MSAPEQPAAPVQPPADLRHRIAQALMSWNSHNSSPAHATLRQPATVTANAYSRADAVLAVVEPELAALRAEVRTLTTVARSNGEAYKGAVLDCEQADTELAALREQLAEARSLHRPVQRGALTICDACSPKRGDGPTRYVLVGYPCPTADVLTAATPSA